MSAPGALKNSSHRRLGKDAVNLRAVKIRDVFLSLRLEDHGYCLGFLFSQSAKGTRLEQAAAWTLLLLSWSRRPRAAPWDGMLLGFKMES